MCAALLWLVLNFTVAQVSKGLLLLKQRSSYHKQWWWPGHWTAWRPRFPPHKCSWRCRSAWRLPQSGALLPSRWSFDHFWHRLNDHFASKISGVRVVLWVDGIEFALGLHERLVGNMGALQSAFLDLQRQEEKLGLGISFPAAKLDWNSKR